MFNLSNFRSTINKYNGLAKPHLYVVTISPPQALTGQNGSVASDLRFFCDAAELPGISVMTTDVRHYNYGPSERKPYAPVFVDTNLTFMLDNKGQILEFFHTWMQNVIDFNGGRGIAGDAVNGAFPYEVHYSDEYTTTITISQFDQHENEIIVYELLSAYPLTINSVPTNWAQANDVERLNVAFTYRSWQTKKLNASSTVSDNQLSSAVGSQSSTLGLTKDLQINSGGSLGLTRLPIVIADIVNAINSTKIF